MEDSVLFYEDCEFIVVKYILESVFDVSIKYNWNTAARNTIVNAFSSKSVTGRLKFEG